MSTHLAELLREGNHSLVVGNGGTHTYDTRGIATLLDLVTTGSPLLRGAEVADRVVGKAAAALMVLGGVTGVYALVVSDGALDLLGRYGVAVGYDRRTPHIVNRTNTGWCPMELACRDCQTAEDCLAEIKKCMKALAEKNNKNTVTK